MPDLVVAGAGMAGLAAAAEARRLGADPLVLEKLPRAGRVDAAVERGHLAPPRLRPVPRRVPGRRRAPPATALRAPRRRTSLARVAGRAGRGARHRQPADDRHALRPRGADGARWSEAAGGVAPGGPAWRGAGQHPAHPRHGRLRGQPRPAARARDPRGGPRLPARGARAAPATGCGSGSRPAAARAPGSTRSTRARCPRRRPASASATSSGCPSSTRRHATVTNERGERYETRTWSEIDVAQWQLRQPRARAWFTVPSERLGRARARAHRRGDGRRRRGGGRARPARR